MAIEAAALNAAVPVRAGRPADTGQRSPQTFDRTLQETAPEALEAVGTSGEPEHEDGSDAPPSAAHPGDPVTSDGEAEEQAAAELGAQAAEVDTVGPAVSTTAEEGSQPDEDGQLPGRAPPGTLESGRSAGPTAPAPAPGNFVAATIVEPTSPGPWQESPVVVRTTADAPASAPSPPPLELDAQGQANVSRVVRGITSAVQQRGGSITLRLQPPELGVMRIEMHIVDGTVRAAFHAEQESVRNLLQHQMGHLRHALESHGLSVDRLQVQTMAGAEASGDTPSRSGEDPTDGRSRGAMTWNQAEAETDDGDEASATTLFEQTLNAVA